MNDFSKPSEDFINYLIECEGLKLKAYKDSGGLLTIGIGTLIDTKEEEYLKTVIITKQQAVDLAIKDLLPTIKFVKKCLIKQLTENQFFALVDFGYNCGIGALQKSVLLKLVNIDPNNPIIGNEFMRWNTVQGKAIKGLTNRCLKRANLYFKKILI